MISLKHGGVSVRPHVFVLQLRKTQEETSTRKSDLTGDRTTTAVVTNKYFLDYSHQFFDVDQSYINMCYVADQHVDHYFNLVDLCDLVLIQPNDSRSVKIC